MSGLYTTRGGVHRVRETTPDSEDPSGDLAPEGIIYIAPEDNTTGNGLIVVANEVSATLSVYTLEEDVLSTERFAATQDVIIAYPNPITEGNLQLSKTTDYRMVDLLGRVVATDTQTNQVPVQSLSAGVYVLHFSNGTTQKIIKQ